MGWTFMERPADVRKHFKDSFKYENDRIASRCLAIALKLDILFAAIEHIHKEDGRREVFAAVFLIKYVTGDDPYNFGYKDQTEHMGPVRTDCPQNILNLLTETDCQTANEWRARCRAKLERKTKEGDVIEFSAPLRFEGGSECQRSTIILLPGRRRRRRALRGDDGALYRIRGLNQRDDWKIVKRAQR